MLAHKTGSIALVKRRGSPSLCSCVGASIVGKGARNIGLYILYGSITYQRTNQVF